MAVSNEARRFPPAASVELLAGDVFFRSVSYVVRGPYVPKVSELPSRRH